MAVFLQLLLFNPTRGLWKATPCNDMWTRPLQWLDRHNLDCGSGNAMTYWTVSSSGCSVEQSTGGQRYKFKYQCTAVVGGVTGTHERTTDCEFMHDRKLENFDRHKVYCGNGEVLRGWTVEGCNGVGHIWGTNGMGHIRYKCSTMKYKGSVKLSSSYTNCEEVAGKGVEYLDRHEINCGLSAIKKFEMKDGDSGSCSGTYRRFYFQCLEIDGYYSCPTSSSAGSPKCKTCRAVSSRTGSNQCTGCNSGYYLSSYTCKAYSCSTGSGTGCRSCKSQSSITTNNHCSSCNSGHYLSGTNCVGYSCSTGSGSNCRTCKSQSSRTTTNHCQTCNPGYYLSGTKCVAYPCSTGSGTSCKTCRSQSSRTASNHCSTCNSGYYLNGTRCLGYPCSTGSDTSCKTCRSQSSRTASNHCSTCNAGNYLNGTRCLGRARPEVEEKNFLQRMPTEVIVALVGGAAAALTILCALINCCRGNDREKDRDAMEQTSPNVSPRRHTHWVVEESPTPTTKPCKDPFKHQVTSVI